VVVEPLVLPAAADSRVSGKPSTAGADADSTGRWAKDDTPSSTLEEHYRMELPRPFSSCSPCGRESHRLQ
jgi:hypothetical protein